MGQKINSTSLRLKKRLNWNTITCLHNKRNLGDMTFQTQIISELTKLSLLHLNFYTNNLVMTKSHKNYQLFSRLVHQTKVFTPNTYVNEFVKNAKIKYLGNETKALSQLHLNGSGVFTEFADFLFRQSRFSFFSKIQHKFLVLSPRIITAFVKRQLKAPFKQKSRSFNSNLQTGLLRVANSLLLLFRNHVIGLQIICSGKWKKTRSGRKQKLFLRFGKIQKNTANNILFYHTIAQKTALGVCSLKIWISLKKMY